MELPAYAASDEHPVNQRRAGTVKDRLEACLRLWQTHPALPDRDAFRGSTRSRTAGNVFTSFGAFLGAVLDRATPWERSH